MKSHINSIFCFLCGLEFVLFSRPVVEFLGLSSPGVILMLGLGLVAYALVIFMQSRKQSLSLPFARFAIAADLLWVIGSAALIFTNLVAFTTAGKWAIAIIADIVLVFAIAVNHFIIIDSGKDRAGFSWHVAVNISQGDKNDSENQDLEPEAPFVISVFNFIHPNLPFIG